MPHDARKIALLLLLAGALGGCQRPADEPAKREAAPPPAEVKPEAPPPPQSPIARARADRDAQVWDGEVAAQDHERAFIDLWDRLRAADAPHEVLASFPVGQLLLGTPGPQDTMEDGLVRWSTRGDGERLDQAGFQAWIAARVAEGWALEQSEWHHSRFTPAQGDAPARSEVSFLLHARSGARRLDVHGTLQVKWAAEPGARGYHEPIEIDARELNMVERTGPEAFAAAIVEDPFPPQQNSRVIQPLIAHDLDGDGLSELIAVGANLVWRNRSEPGTIRLAPPEPLITPVRGTAGGGLVADVTGDGLVDLVRVVYGDAVYVHRGVKGGGFAPAEAPAVTLPEPLLAGLAITAGDIDGDRDLDLFVTQYKRPYRFGQMPTPYYDANDGFPAYLLVNDGEGAFTDKTVEAGLAAKRNRRTYSASLYDIDGDRDLDLLVVSDFSGVDLYQNDGRGRFTDITDSHVDERANFGMAHTIGDFNGDGILDLYVVGMSSTTARRLERLGLGRDDFPEHQAMRMKMAYGNRLYEGTPEHTLRHSPHADQVARTGWSWGATSFDFDRDGDLDLYVGNGHVSRKSAKDYCTTFWRHDIYDASSELDPKLNDFYLEEFQDVIDEGVSWNGFEHNKLLVNVGAAGFLEAGYPLSVAHEEDARSVIADDLDGDGRVDLVIIRTQARAGTVAGETTDERLAIARNTSEDANHWIGVRLASDRPWVGAHIEVTYPGGAQQHRVVLGDSYLAQHAPGRLFGLGAHDSVTAIEVVWGDGKRSNVSAPPVDRYVTVK